MPQPLIAESKPVIAAGELLRWAHDGSSHPARQGDQTTDSKPSATYQLFTDQPGDALSEQALLAWEAFMAE